jgi:hypothetical protein
MGNAMSHFLPLCGEGRHPLSQSCFALNLALMPIQGEGAKSATTCHVSQPVKRSSVVHNHMSIGRT